MQNIEYCINIKLLEMNSL